MGVIIRRGVKEDCTRLLELITELAVYEKAPDDVTVTLEHFTESGFGEKPVWWAGDVFRRYHRNRSDAGKENRQTFIRPVN